MPTVRVEKDYLFDTPEGKRSLLEVFEGRRQLIVYHAMWLFEEDQLCPSCSLLIDDDYQATIDPARGLTTYNFATQEGDWAGEVPGPGDRVRARGGRTCGGCPPRRPPTNTPAHSRRCLTDTNFPLRCLPHAVLRR